MLVLERQRQKTGPKPVPWQERLMRYVSPEPNSGCWLWEGAQNNRGYGYIGLSGAKGGNVLAHRSMWELTNGPIPDGLWVLHRCDVRICCNPDHLFLGTPLDNMRDMHAKGRFVPNTDGFKRKAACKKGHLFTDENTVVVSGVRRCRECWNTYMRQYNAAKKLRG